MNEHPFVKLAHLFALRRMDSATAYNTTLRVRHCPEKLIEWLEENPDATVTEICEKSRELHMQYRRLRPPIIEDGKTLDELVENCPTDMRYVAALRAEGATDEEIWQAMLDF